MSKLGKFFLSLFLISMLFFPILVSSAPTEVNYQHPYIPLNITLPNYLDPKYYSFEAYQIKPPTNVTPIIIPVAVNATFNNTGLMPIVKKIYIPPSNYSLILMNVSIWENNGAQYDRAAYIFVNGVPVFWGSTQELANSSSQVDLTLFENLLKGNVTFQLVIENFYDAKIGITGLYHMNVTLILYPGNKPKGLPNMFIPLYLSKYNYSYIILNPVSPSITQQVTIPNGTYKMELLLYEEGGGLDEFWYTNEPATRSILIYYDNLLAGVVNPYETIYTGGIDLFWWKPLTSINTLSFHSPIVIDLTPMLAYGLTANITTCVTNLLTAYQITGSTAFDWDISGVLMLWVNQSNPLMLAKPLTSISRFIDSTPIFSTGFSAGYYQEDGNYLLNYSSLLTFEHGKELAWTLQVGKFVAYQTFNQIFEKAYLDERFYEVSVDKGIYNSTLVISGNYPVLLDFSAIAVPISNPHVIPYNLSYFQNGSLSLGLEYYYEYLFNDYNTTIKTMENLTAIGGFGGIIEIINSYGGAILVKLTANYANTQKNLTTWFLVNNEGYKEIFSAQGMQNSTTNLTGYYRYVHISFSSS
ncbi:glycopeptidase [Sulfolobus sp. S-194]|uniref:peptide-N4-asparagine amidase n=1 Tax=Sulfolobus sp. S-194 TaxID=2512240 RepID=UPI00143729E8|nr:peptide-N4-asparagine amidase [Sulfolobus sp. S-194]QIW25145.1 glycopeptidase [Sulfolobus sp. S-194]